MIKLYELLIYGHFHKWEIIKEYQESSHCGLIQNKYDCKCKKCGRITSFGGV